ncbi:Methyltransferase domain-containing protein [Halogranum gelatinilyticum]|uniref:Methyltransferase domain-containing protein n=1 Tax=Halogranum gelatinilyticum TaxID=660521 RepID=A0A1G9T8S9_9EURY|nr:class I SAM-dependent methyltransferase [Halogranum gelatinilyticum]SDM44020.1 Methyltransferase domain-containing protein [Halogranum gelatinilyticum]
MDVPTTVSAALADQPVEGAVCLEAGAGVGNTTAGLLAAGAERVYAVTNDADHAATVRERVADDHPGRAAVLESDLRALPLAADSVDVVTAHGLLNVLTPAALDTVVSELTRVAAPGCRLVVDDYDPLPAEAAVRDLFALENAASELARGESALTFYPATSVRRTAVGAGWTFDRERTLLEPVPWTAGHVEAHANVARSFASQVSGDLGASLAAEADRLQREIGSEDVGRMYSLAFRFPE